MKTVEPVGTFVDLAAKIHPVRILSAALHANLIAKVKPAVTMVAAEAAAHAAQSKSALRTYAIRLVLLVVATLCAARMTVASVVACVLLAINVTSTDNAVRKVVNLSAMEKHADQTAVAACAASVTMD